MKKDIQWWATKMDLHKQLNVPLSEKDVNEFSEQFVKPIWDLAKETIKYYEVGEWND